jgi:DNA repair protein RecO (recombination protein O)
LGILKELLETEGIVFRTMKYSETSLIVDIYTFEVGLKSFIINGVRSSKSKSHSNIYQVMNLLNISFYNKEGEQLLRLSSAHFSSIYESIFIDIMKTSVGIFLIECTRNCIKEKEQNDRLFDYIKTSFLTLDQLPSSKLGTFNITYLLGISNYLGFFPYNNFSAERPYFDMLNGRYAKFGIDSRHTMDLGMSQLLSQVLADKDFIIPSKNDRDNLLDEIIIYFKLHVDQFKDIKSLEILREIMK